MSRVIVANKLQYEVLTSESRLTVITAEPGAGSTTALVIKAIERCRERKLTCSFFVPSFYHATACGGVISLIKDMVGDSARLSKSSSIFTFKNESKIKVVPCSGEHSLECSMGLSRDLLLFDSNIPKDFISSHLPRAYEAVVVDSIVEIEKEDSWANSLNLLEREGGKVVGFVSGVSHVRGKLEDNYMFADRGTYSDLVSKAIPWRMRTEF